MGQLNHSKVLHGFSVCIMKTRNPFSHRPQQSEEGRLTLNDFPRLIFVVPWRFSQRFPNSIF